MSIFVIFVRLRWMNRDKQGSGGYCEISNGTLFVEPINTMSNFGFIIVGLIISWQMMCGSFKKNINVLTQSDFMSILFSSLIICLGPGSMVMHAFYTSWGVKLDVLSMYFVCAFLVAYSTQRLFHVGIQYFICIFPLVIIICEWVSRCTFRIPIFEYATNFIFACFLTLSIVTEIIIVLIQQPSIEKRWGIASFLTLLIAFIIWNFSKTGDSLCYPQSWIQGHALWHLLDAIALYFLFRYYVSEHTEDRYTLIEETDNEHEEMII